MLDYVIRKTKLEDMTKDYTPDQIEKFAGVKYTSDVWENSELVIEWRKF